MSTTMTEASSDITTIRLVNSPYGNAKREVNIDDSLLHGKNLPRPVEYEDVDKAVFEFVRDKLDLVDEKGELMPTYTLFSNERFTEYSQTWRHTDKEGNLIMNFKTVNRENTPSYGKNQGGNYNIPGDRRYTVYSRDALTDDGTECYEVYSMSQPIPIDFTYRITLVTTKNDNLNKFNTRMNELFKAIQCYVCPNGYYMPMKIESFSDESDYSINGRKFFSQMASVKLLGYVIPESSFKIERFPKRVLMGGAGGKNERSGVKVDVVEYDDDTLSVDIVMRFSPSYRKVSFTLASPFTIAGYTQTNVRSFKAGSADGEQVSLLCPDATSELSEDYQKIFTSTSATTVTVVPVDTSKTCLLTISGNFTE